MFDMNKHELKVFILVLFVSTISIFLFNNIDSLVLLETINTDFIDENSIDNNLIKLSDNWDFYYDELFTSQDFVNNSHVKIKTGLQDWKALGYSTIGKATYRKIIKNNSKINNFGMKIKNAYSNYDLYINGEKIDGLGKNFIKDKDNKLDSDYHFFILEDNQDIEIIIHVINHNYMIGGLSKAPLLSTEANIIIHKNFMFASIMIAFMMLLLLAFGMILLYLVDKNDSSMLYMAVSIICYSFKALIYTNGHSGLIYFNMPFQFTKQLFFIFELMSMVFLTWSISSYYKDSDKKLIFFLNCILLLCIPITFLLPFELFVYVHGVSVIAGAISIVAIFILSSRTLVKQPSESAFYFISIVMIAIVFFQDILTLNISIYRMICFLFFYSTVIFEMVNRNSNNIKDLSAIKVNLENDVLDKRVKLEKVNRDLQNEIKARIVAEKNLARIPDHDNYTGFYNSVYAKNYITRQISMNNRYGTTFSLIMIEINELSAIRDTFNDVMTKQTIKETLDEINSIIRNSDQITSWKEDRFLILMPNCNDTNNLIIVEKITNALNQLVIKDIGKVSISYGITSISENDSVEDIIDRLEIDILKNK